MLCVFKHLGIYRLKDYAGPDEQAIHFMDYCLMTCNNSGSNTSPSYSDVTRLSINHSRGLAGVDEGMVDIEVRYYFWD